MSLKAFHIIFITICFIFGIGFGAWGVLAFRSSGDKLNLLMGVVSFAGSVGLAWYGHWVLKKLKNAGGFFS